MRQRVVVHTEPLCQLKDFRPGKKGQMKSYFKRTLASLVSNVCMIFGELQL